MSCVVSTLLYCFNPDGQTLLMLRAQEPNLGCWSPCGGKIHLQEGESPHAGAQREAWEELGLRLDPTDLHLTGLVTERGGPGQSHWLMFLFEVLPPIPTLPPPHREGRFGFFAKEQLADLPLPTADRQHLWPLFWAHRGGFFAARCLAPPAQQWIMEASQPAPRYVGTAPD